MNIMAIDPGKNGGICIARTHLFGAMGRALPFELPIRLYTIPLCGGLVDVEWLQEKIIEKQIDVMVLEKQQIRSAQRGQATIMESYGMLRATAVLCGVEVYELRPQAWQAALGLSGDKQEHIDYAEAAGFDIPWTSYKKDGEPMMRATKHDGMADAVCIALAYMRMVEND